MPRIPCPICGGTYLTYQSKLRVTCSNRCRRKAERDRATERRVPAEFILRTLHDYALELQEAGRNER